MIDWLCDWSVHLLIDWKLWFSSFFIYLGTFYSASLTLSCVSSFSVVYNIPSKTRDNENAKTIPQQNNAQNIKTIEQYRARDMIWPVYIDTLITMSSIICLPEQHTPSNPPSVICPWGLLRARCQSVSDCHMFTHWQRVCCFVSCPLSFFVALCFDGLTIGRRPIVDGSWSLCILISVTGCSVAAFHNK